MQYEAQVLEDAQRRALADPGEPLTTTARSPESSPDPDHPRRRRRGAVDALE
jgi:hypothetical protein